MAVSECDPSLALYLQPAPPVKGSRSPRPMDPDGPWGLACYLSDAIPKKWGVFLGLDVAEKRHATKYMKSLLEEHDLTPDRIRSMVDAFVAKTGSQRLDYPVGRFWSMRRELESDTAPAHQKEYASWSAPTPAASRGDYSGWLR